VDKVAVVDNGFTLEGDPSGLLPESRADFDPAGGPARSHPRVSSDACAENPRALPPADIARTPDATSDATPVARSGPAPQS
jgi:hypothetical protein